ncbi:hypothetical protein CLAIMM_13678 [Cladophialophora immunda]|nr:hypothetical protein CLAIMM_13678 [Cladophialophora immunda]
MIRWERPRVIHTLGCEIGGSHALTYVSVWRQRISHCAESTTFLTDAAWLSGVPEAGTASKHTEDTARM